MESYFARTLCDEVNCNSNELMLMINLSNDEKKATHINQAIYYYRRKSLRMSWCFFLFLTYISADCCFVIYLYTCSFGTFLNNEFFVVLNKNREFNNLLCIDSAHGVGQCLSTSAYSILKNSFSDEVFFFFFLRVNYTHRIWNS